MDRIFIDWTTKHIDDTEIWKRLDLRVNFFFSVKECIFDDTLRDTQKIRDDSFTANVSRKLILNCLVQYFLTFFLMQYLDPEF